MPSNSSKSQSQRLGWLECKRVSKTCIFVTLTEVTWFKFPSLLWSLKSKLSSQTLTPHSNWSWNERQWNSTTKVLPKGGQCSVDSYISLCTLLGKCGTVWRVYIDYYPNSNQIQTEQISYLCTLIQVHRVWDRCASAVWGLTSSYWLN